MLMLLLPLTYLTDCTDIQEQLIISKY